MRTCASSHRYLIWGFLLIISSILLTPALTEGSVKITVEKNDPGETEWTFNKVIGASRSDFAQKAKLSVVEGKLDRRGGDVQGLNNGRIQWSRDENKTSIFFSREDSKGGKILMDLRWVTEIVAINTYSWHKYPGDQGARGPQVYTLYGSASDSPKTDDPANDPAWTLIAKVDTRPNKTGEKWGGQYGVNIANTTGLIGKYHYLLWVIEPTLSPLQKNPGETNTFYGEFDVHTKETIAMAGDLKNRKKIIYIIPHSHIDAEWRWTYEVGLKWSEDIFSRALDIMRKDPDYHFAQDQTALLKPVYERMSRQEREFFKKMVKEGRFEIVGGMYMQPEVAEPRGESLIRQILVGKKWVSRVLGVDVQVGWFIDTFGQINQIPQILAKSGFKYYVFWRDTPRDKAPSEIPTQFWYESPDGSRILTHKFPKGYGGPRHLEAIFDQSPTRHLLVPYGDDVTRPKDDSKNMERKVAWMVEQSGFSDAISRIKTASVDDYFKAVEVEAENLPVLRYDFSPPYRAPRDLRGTYDERIELKKLNRRTEEALYAAEVINSVAFTKGYAYPREMLNNLWLNLLHVHFHDIIGGSHHDLVYKSAMYRLQSAVDGAQFLTDEAVKFLVGSSEKSVAKSEQRQIYVFNPLSETRSELCRYALDMPYEEAKLIDSAGKSVPSRIIKDADGKAQIEFIAENVPAVGGRMYRLVKGSNLPGSSKTTQHRCVGKNAIENQLFRITWDPATGELVQIHDKINKHDLLAPSAGSGNEIIAVAEKGPDAEGGLRLTDTSYRSSDYQAASIKIEESDIHIGLVVRKPFKDCTLVRKVLLYDSLERIDLRTSLEDFVGGDLFIKVSFPLALDWEKVSIDYETPFSVTNRQLPEHYCAQNWVDCSADGFGVALINTGTPGYWVDKNRLEMVILRSLANYTGYRAELMAEHGTHRYYYALYSHKGCWSDSRVVSVGRSLNSPLIVTEVNTELVPEDAKKSFLSAPPEFAITAIKLSETGSSLVVRGYETTGQKRIVSLNLPAWARKAALCDLMENELKLLTIRNQMVKISCAPHEIVTLMLRP